MMSPGLQTLCVDIPKMFTPVPELYL